MFLLEPLRVILALAESLVMFFVVLFGGGAFTMPGDYLRELNRMGVYENRAQESLPQGIVYDIVLEHFSQARADGRAPKCLVVGYDGARADALANMEEGKSGLLALKAGGGGIYNAYAGGNFPRWQATSTGPGWTTVLTGRWAKERGGTGHGVDDNGVVKPEDSPKLLFTELLERKLVKKTAFVVAKDEHFSREDAAYINDVAYCKANKLKAAWIKTDGDAETVKQTKKEILAGTDMVMGILKSCDSTGHNFNFGNHCPEYVQAFRESDQGALELINAVKSRPTYAKEDWLIIIVSDHGGFATGHGPQFSVAQQVFIAMNKPL